MLYSSSNQNWTNLPHQEWWKVIEDLFHVHQFFKVPEFNKSMQENQPGIRPGIHALLYVGFIFNFILVIGFFILSGIY